MLPAEGDELDVGQRIPDVCGVRSAIGDDEFVRVVLWRHCQRLKSVFFIAFDVFHHILSAMNRDHFALPVLMRKLAHEVDGTGKVPVLFISDFRHRRHLLPPVV